MSWARLAPVWEDCIGCGAPPEHSSICSYCKRARRLLPSMKEPSNSGWVGDGKPKAISATKYISVESVRRANDRMICNAHLRRIK